MRFCSAPLWVWIISALTRWTVEPVEVMLLDTTRSTAEMGWSTHPDTGWDEVSVLDDRNQLIRTYEVCNFNLPNQNNWLATPFVMRGSAPRMHVTLRFSVRDCSSVRNVGASCKETFTLYYKEADSQTEALQGWGETEDAGEPGGGGWVKIDTIAADKSFSRVEQSQQHESKRGHRMNVKTRSFGPLTRKGFILGFVDSGACISLVGVSLFYRKCPETFRSLAHFPDMPSGAEPSSLVPVDGSCVPNAQSQTATTPKLHCNADGDWMVPVGVCVCEAGFESNQNGSACTACRPGHFKSDVSESPSCSPCPAQSHSSQEGSSVCQCLSGFYRAPEESSDSPCTAPPSAPQDLHWESEGSGLTLRWRAPLSLGSREDLHYNVLCRMCPAPSTVCLRCGDGITFTPGQQGLSQTRVQVHNLLPRVHYTFQVQAVNGVTGQSPQPPQYSSVNVSISQSVPSSVPMMHQVSRTPDSITLSWPQPDNPNGDILDYQIRYFDKSGDEESSVLLSSETNMATVQGLSSGTIYVFQIRARNEMGYGAYSGKLYFQTLLEEERSEAVQKKLPLMVGSVLGGMAFLLVGAVLILVFVFRSKRRESTYSDRLQRYISTRGGGVKYYVDPSTYEDPNEAIREFAREIDPAHVKIEEVIGAGEFGEVCRGKLKPAGKREITVAIKTLRSSCMDSEKCSFLSEASTMGQFDNPNVLKLEGVVTRSRPVMIISEFMENGALDSFLRENEGQFSMLQLVGMLRGIAAGMRYLSEMNFVHRDLAARNVLVNSNLVCKVSDFGLSRFLRGDDESLPTYTAALGSKIPIRWTAPESIQYRKFTSASDVWSFGIVMWEVTSYGERPYWDMSNQEVMTAVGDEYRLPAPPNCPGTLHSLMLDCWLKDRSERPGFEQIVSTLDKLIRHPAGLKAISTHTNRPSQPLLSNTPVDFSTLSSVSDWLDALKMGRYKEEFSSAGMNSLETVSRMTLEDIQRVGVSLLGHQKKILNSIQLLRVHQNQGQIEV
ncbi:ephrin type-B receptor 5 isoform X1 [Acipenser oxyrinchus oxyrinchus]|uniref:receptor protein-tyrosine kinase n=1 Tax=Acipenser oxyrinchus oxyrinchus TaxID=40147 RepID=A0AAD8D6A9_ACIOX|nr:ephrin type-B receptor 5 isoform X1 [Acipenser oxyrinchus oxyrinchus]